MRILAALLLSLASATAFALPTVEDVQHAVHRGDYAAAESMVREVLVARPDNARAHYLLSELLAHEGKLNEARTQAATARQLDPSLRFTAPERFRQFENELAATPKAKSPGTAPVAVPRRAEEPAAGGAKSASDSSAGGSSMLWLLILLGVGAFFLFVRRRPQQPPGYGGGYPAPNGMPPAGSGYPGGYPGGYPPAQPPGGVGRTVAAGLGGLAAGMVAEHLLEEAMDSRHHGDNAAHPLQHGVPDDQSIEDRPIDFGNGGNDWGGDSGGGNDSGGGFDSGSGGDWS